MSLNDEIRSLLNKHSAENGSNTPDHILADYLCGCLAVFEASVRMRDTWYGIEHKPVDTEEAASVCCYDGLRPCEYPQCTGPQRSGTARPEEDHDA